MCVWKVLTEIVSILQELLFNMFICKFQSCLRIYSLLGKTRTEQKFFLEKDWMEVEEVPAAQIMAN